jgi:hypothetical protein
MLIKKFKMWPVQVADNNINRQQKFYSLTHALMLFLNVDRNLIEIKTLCRQIFHSCHQYRWVLLHPTFRYVSTIYCWESWQQNICQPSNICCRSNIVCCLEGERARTYLIFYFCYKMLGIIEKCISYFKFVFQTRSFIISHKKSPQNRQFGSGAN